MLNTIYDKLLSNILYIKNKNNIIYISKLTNIKETIQNNLFIILVIFKNNTNSI